MAKVKIQGNASGTGVVTLTAPNTNTDRTITLPDEDITLGGGVDGIVSTANATAITIDSNENVGIGVTPSSNDWTALQVGNGASLIGRTSSNNFTPFLSGNSYYSSGWKYHNTGYATQLEQYTDNTDGKFIFKVAPSGTADTAISWTTAMTITNDGRGLSQFTAKAWCNFDQSNHSLNDSHNVSSVVDNGVGESKVNFINSLNNADYSVSGSNIGSTNSWSATTAFCNDQNKALNVSYCNVRMFDGQNHVARDMNHVSVQVFGD